MIRLYRKIRQLLNPNRSVVLEDMVEKDDQIIIHLSNGNYLVVPINEIINDLEQKERLAELSGK